MENLYSPDSGSHCYRNNFLFKFSGKKNSRGRKKKVNVWVQSLKTRANATEPSALDLTNIITSENTDIPIIETDENDHPLGLGLNLDTNKIKSDTNYLKKKVREFKNQHGPIIVEVSRDPLIINKYYYGNSVLLKQIRYYPLVQLLIVALFIFIILYSISVRNKSTQNQVWAGMAKETAHQLGTPISSLQGWVEMLKERETDNTIAMEMEKDVDRLKLISDRFGKIGSSPKLEEKNIVEQVRNMVVYIKRRSTEKINFTLDTGGIETIYAKISASLFDWVIENLLKNALDAMEGKGSINIKIKTETAVIIIDITDTGKGISKKISIKFLNLALLPKSEGGAWDYRCRKE
ncbi:MAG: HAMP domain-containing sensor histidine kinase [Chitinophagaceae bacterium]